MEFLKDGEVAKQENNFAVPWQTRLADNPMSLATSVLLGSIMQSSTDEIVLFKIPGRSGS